MRMEMWPLALPHGYCHDVIKSSVRSGVERFRVEEKKKMRDEEVEMVIEISINLTEKWEGNY